MATAEVQRDVREAERPRRAPEMERRVPELPEEERKLSMQMVTGGSAFQALCGITAGILTILGLATVAPVTMAAIAAIAIGVGLLFEGSALAMRYRRLPEELTEGRWATMELIEGTAGQFFGGLAGLVFGILALVGVAPAVTLPIAVLLFAIALLTGSGTTLRLSNLQDRPEAHRWVGYRVVTSAAAGFQVLLGLAAGVLGVLALIGTTPIILSLVALLVTAVAVVVSGAAISGRIVTMLRS